MEDKPDADSGASQDWLDESISFPPSLVIELSDLSQASFSASSFKRRPAL
jgi:hypothetical protein